MTIFDVRYNSFVGLPFNNIMYKYRGHHLVTICFIYHYIKTGSYFEFSTFPFKITKIKIIRNKILSFLITCYIGEDSEVINYVLKQNCLTTQT